TGDSGENARLSQVGATMVALGEQRLMDAGFRTVWLRGLYNRKASTALSHWIARNDDPDTVYHVHGWSQILSPSIFAGLSPVISRTIVTAHDFFLACPN